MKNKAIDNLFRFDYGLEDIVTARPSHAKLPDGHPTLMPGQESILAQVDKYWEAKSLENFILSFMAPAIRDTGLLIPRRFRRMLREIKAKLKHRADTGAKDPDEAWQPAIEVLEAEEALMELANMYYNSLHKA